MNNIINILKEKKSIPLDQFINIALYDKKFGYYMKNNPFGKEGDFITSPSISNLFGEMLAIWCVAFWEHIGKPKKILESLTYILVIFLIIFRWVQCSVF